MRPHTLAAVVFGLSVAACASTPGADDVEQVASHMTGTYSSAEQHNAAADDFFDIRLVMTPVWTSRDDGPWLYVEQAIEGRTDKPYRQRVYRLRSEGPGAVASEVFTLPGDPLRFVGAWAADPPLGALEPKDLTPRAGCAIHLKKQADGSWKGATEGKGCASELRGASYATADVTLVEGLLQSWDRGYDAAGKQVWGPEKGPYRFVRLAKTPPETPVAE